MKRFTFPSLLAAVALLAATALSSCDTGTEKGATNVERGDYKTKDPDPGRSTNGDSVAGGVQRQPDAPTGRDVYEDAADRKDRDNNGLAD